MTDDHHTNVAPIRPRLGLWDAVSIIIGIVVGTTIYRGTSMIFSNAGGPWMSALLWLVGGALAWCGAACYAELATTYPRDGGDYEYLNRAFGRWCGFLFAWSQLAIIISGNIAIMAYAFADYAARIWPTAAAHPVWFTVAPVVILSALNLAGIVAGKIAQNILTVSKIMGLAGLIVAGLLATAPVAKAADIASAAPASPSSANYGLALIFVLYAFGGWAHISYVAAEVRDEQRNMPRALLLGLAGITLIYLAVTGAYFHALGFEVARHSATPAAEVLARALGPRGDHTISLLIMLSALGAINGMILTGVRIYAVWGADYSGLRWLNTWNQETAPMAAIALQAVVAMLLILLVGTGAGRDLFDTGLRAIHLNGVPWEIYEGGFNTLVAGSAPAFWFLCLLTGIAVFVLRTIDPAAVGRIQMPLYPLPAIAFCLTCGYMLWSSVDYSGWLSLIGVVPLALGLPAWLALKPSKGG